MKVDVAATASSGDAAVPDRANAGRDVDARVAARARPGRVLPAQRELREPPVFVRERGLLEGRRAVAAGAVGSHAELALVFVGVAPGARDGQWLVANDSLTGRGAFRGMAGA